MTFSLFGYTTFATAVLLIAGKNLVKIDFDQLRYEADFRYGLVHIRDNAESIAFIQAKSQKKVKLKGDWEVVRNFNLLIIWRVIIDVMRRSINYAGNFFPYLLAIPYFKGDIDYGRLFKQTLHLVW